MGYQVTAVLHAQYWCNGEIRSLLWLKEYSAYQQFLALILSFIICTLINFQHIYAKAIFARIWNINGSIVNLFLVQIKKIRNTCDVLDLLQQLLSGLVKYQARLLPTMWLSFSFSQNHSDIFGVWKRSISWWNFLSTLSSLSIYRILIFCNKVIFQALQSNRENAIFHRLKYWQDAEFPLHPVRCDNSSLKELFYHERNIDSKCWLYAKIIGEV